ncbi:MAG: ATP-binding cassette domain-containing protein [Myxococcota bacterium]
MADQIRLRNLRIEAAGRLLVDDVALTCTAGELLAVVGASGSGKTLTCRALLGLVDLQPGVVQADLTIMADQVRHRPYQYAIGVGRTARDRSFRSVRGDVVGYLPQQAGAALDPLERVGPQVARAAQLGGNDPDPTEWLGQAGFSESDRQSVVDRFPHELSGGMAQRVAIAQLLARGSRFVVADEPMTGLDAPVQQRLARRFRGLAERGLGVIIVTHDLSLVHAIADRVLLVDRGRIAEVWSRTQIEARTASTAAGLRLLRAMP